MSGIFLLRAEGDLVEMTDWSLGKRRFRIRRRGAGAGRSIWPIEVLRARFEARCEIEGREPDDVILELVGDETEAAAFWEEAETNLRAGKIRLAFVADVIPPELRRVIEFLNTQMTPAEVLGVEIRQYVGEGLSTLVPTVVGQTAEAQQRKGRAMVPRRAAWSWDAYRDDLGVPQDRVEVIRAVHDRVVEAIRARGLNWQPAFRQGYVAFQRPSGYNVVILDLWWRKVPRFAVKLPRHPDELGLASPYPDLAASWQSGEKEWGWTIPSVELIPDVGRALDLVRPYHPDTGPMVVPSDTTPRSSGLI